MRILISLLILLHSKHNKQKLETRHEQAGWEGKIDCKLYWNPRACNI